MSNQDETLAQLSGEEQIEIIYTVTPEPPQPIPAAKARKPRKLKPYKLLSLSGKKARAASQRLKAMYRGIEAGFTSPREGRKRRNDLASFRHQTYTMTSTFTVYGNPMKVIHTGLLPQYIGQAKNEVKFRLKQHVLQLKETRRLGQGTTEKVIEKISLEEKPE